MSYTARSRPSHVPVTEPWCRLRVERPDGHVVARHTLHGVGAPDLDTLDAVARLLLLTRRGGTRLVVEDAVPELRELIDLAGLVLPVEPGGEAELGEHPAGVEQIEEEAHLGDPPA